VINFDHSSSNDLQGLQCFRAHPAAWLWQTVEISFGKVEAVTSQGPSRPRATKLVALFVSAQGPKHQILLILFEIYPSKSVPVHPVPE
jgi:hypothetical protein